MATSLRALRPSLLLLHRQPLTSSIPILSKPSSSLRPFHSSTPRLADAATTPVKKPAGAFRSGILGFLLGSTLAGAATWFYIMEEYRVSNELLTEDIYALQAAVQRIHTLVLGLEERLVLAEMKGGKK